MSVAAPLAVLGAGLVCGLGLSAAESCAAIRCGINNFQETRFIAGSGDWLVGSAVSLEEPWRGREKLARMAALAIGECLAAAAGFAADAIPVLLCVAEEQRPGRLGGLDRLLLDEIGALLGHALDPRSRIVPQGRVGGAVALLNARRMLAESGGPRRVVVAGVDSYLLAPTLASLDAADRLLTPANSNGFIPGEAAAAVLLGPHEEGVAALLLRGLGFGREPAPLGSGKPLRAEGLVVAVRGALGEAGIGMATCDHRIADVSGEQYRFKEAALAVTRLLRDRKVRFGLWHTADCIGEVGAAALPAMLAVLEAGARKDYLPGPVFLGHLGNDDDRRAAFVAQATLPQSLAEEARAWDRFGLKRRGEAA